VPELEAVAAVRDFLETGGRVLFYIGLTTLAMWTIILERFWYFRRGHPAQAKRIQEIWEARSDRSSWNAHQIRRLLISEVQTRLDQGLITIKTLVALCPCSEP
jgi:biopolymer transport protein ExbB